MPARASSVTPGSERSQRGSLLDVAIVSLAACIAGIANDYANDDIELIARNTRVHDLSRWRDWLTMPYWPPPFSPDLYRPLTTALHAVEYTLGAGAPVVFRIVSYLLYATACAGVFLLCAPVLSRQVALVAAAVFAAHPVHVEAVAIGVGQAELLVGILSLAACLHYIRRRVAGPLRVRDWGGIALLYLAACLAKEQGLILPALLLALEFTLAGRDTVRRHVDALRGIVILAPVVAVVLAMRVHVLGEFGGTFTAEALDGTSLGVRVLTMVAIVPQWLRLLLWPAHLQADYSPQEIVASSSFGTAEAFGLFALVTLGVATWRLRLRAPMFSFGVAWCAITLIPISNVIIVTGIVLAERTLFLPSIGAVLAVAGLYAFAAKSFELTPRAERLVGAVAALLILAGIARSIERERVWRSDAFLVARTIKDAPRSFRNQRAFGDLMFELDQPRLGHEAYGLALKYVPKKNAWRVRNSYARALVHRGELAGATEQYRLSLAQRPDQDYERAELVVAYLAMGRYSDAAAESDSARMRGGDSAIYRPLRDIADSAARVGARPGSIRIGLGRGIARADR